MITNILQKLRQLFYPLLTYAPKQIPAAGTETGTERGIDAAEEEGYGYLEDLLDNPEIQLLAIDDQGR